MGVNAQSCIDRQLDICDGKIPLPPKPFLHISSVSPFSLTGPPVNTILLPPPPPFFPLPSYPLLPTHSPRPSPPPSALSFCCSLHGQITEVAAPIFLSLLFPYFHINLEAPSISRHLHFPCCSGCSVWDLGATYETVFISVLSNLLSLIWILLLLLPDLKEPKNVTEKLFFEL